MMTFKKISLYEDESGGVIGIKITVKQNGNERTVIIGSDDKGNLQLGGVGPNGEKSGKADPTGNGNNPLGK